MDKEVSRAQLANMSLHSLTEVLGTDGLVQRFSHDISSFDVEEQYMANQAMYMAYTLHEGDPRVREPYINHPLRVTLRMIRHYEIRDIDVICASLLHDVVEDHADELSVYSELNATPREQALDVVSRWFNPRVSELVSAVSNPMRSPDLDKQEQYLGHLAELALSDDVWPMIIKMSDFTDNATGIHYTTGPKVLKLANKYLPAVPIYRMFLERDDLPLSGFVISHMKAQLAQAEVRLSQLVA